MTTHIALLRGINVGGHKKVAMSALRDLFTRLGFVDTRSLLQSGNLVFRTDAGTAEGADLERLLEAEVARHLDLQTDLFVRTGEEWKAIIARNPFSLEAERDPGHLIVMCLKDAAGARNVTLLQKAISGPEIVRADGKQLYIVYPNGMGTSRLTNALIDKTLGTRGTGRNWNTVLKLGALV